jgi:uncharacterized protein (DUF302 family)
MSPTTIKYGMQRSLSLPFDEVVERTRAALQKAGFGVLFEIDMKAKLREKLDVEFGSYLILGACNPPIAYEALQTEIALGLLLPCNVVVYEQSGETVVAAIDAAKMMTIVENPQLTASAGIINEKLKNVLDQL